MEKEYTVNEKKIIAARTTAMGVWVNVFLAAFKLFAGFYGHSAAMVSDAVHSLSDVLASLIAFIGLAISKKRVDREHPYGHDRFECFASMLLAVILFITGAKIGTGCIRDILDKSYLDAAQPGAIALLAAVISILLKEGMYHYTLRQAKKLNSGAFKADAWHHRSDALSSIGALAGILGARLGYPVMDTAAGLIISMVILFVAAGILKDAADKLVDSSVDPGFEDELRKSISDFAGNGNADIGIDSIVTRKFGEKIYVDLEINLDGDMKLKEAHDIAESVHSMIEEKYSTIKHVMVHINPAGYKYSIRA